MFGQRASWQTVWRLSPSTNRLTLWYCPGVAMRMRNHSGRGTRGAPATPEPPPPICTKPSLIAGKCNGAASHRRRNLHVERDVEGGGAVGDPADGEEIDAGLGDGASGFRGNAARG